MERVELRVDPEERHRVSALLASSFQPLDSPTPPELAEVPIRLHLERQLGPPRGI
jgi:hypothetical protein